MAEHARKHRASPAGREAPQARGGGYAALQARARSRLADHAALLNGRAIQRRVITGSGQIGSTGAQPLAGAAPIQMVWQYGARRWLEGQGGRVHWHYTFDDAVVNSLHMTIADVQNYSARTWASRKSYTPTGIAAGTWSGWVNQHGTTPAWATQLAGNQGSDDAVAAFHGNPAVAALLLARFPPPPAPDLADDNAFPALGAP